MIGRVFDRKYRVERLVGKGGMGEVYEAVHVILDRRVALKVMHREHLEKPGAAERFLREAKAASEIGHPNIIDVQDVGIEGDGTVYIVMELLEGKTLDQLLDEKRKLHPALAVHIILQVLSGLHAAHRKGIVHRDLKPENVFIAIDQQGRELVKLVDFGIAVIHRQDGEDLSLTGPGRLMGTPNYISPEQIRGKKDIDGRVDVWAAGVMLYEMVSGRMPFVGETYNEVLSKILLDEPPPLMSGTASIPDAVAEIVKRALVKNRQKRYQSASEFIGDLYSLQGPTSKPPPSVATISGTFPRPSTGDFSNRSRTSSGSGSGSWTGDRLAVTSDLRATANDGEGADPADSTPMGWRGREGESKRLGPGFWAASGIGLAAIIGIVVVLVFFTGGKEQREAEPPPPAQVEQLPELAAEPEPEPEPEAEPAVDKVAAPEPPPADKGPAAPAEVKISLQGLPPGAEITVSGVPVAAEFSRAKSEIPVVLKVLAAGYEPYERAISFEKDQTIVIGMRKRVGSGDTQKKVKHKGQPEPEGSLPPAESVEEAPAPAGQEQQDEVMADNPFGG
jgi:serine/threonine-protein kinase